MTRDSSATPSSVTDLASRPVSSLSGSAANRESRITNHCDVVIAGASFAGLAVAQRIGRSSFPAPRGGEGRVRGMAPRPRVVLLDRAPLGAGVTSACGAPVSIVRAMGAEESVQQIHDRLVLHTPAGEAVWPLPE